MRGRQTAEDGMIRTDEPIYKMFDDSQLFTVKTVDRSVYRYTDAHK